MRRAWIIGNGPSLMDTPLDLLSGEDTFAVNNIHKIFPHTSWRPKYYIRVDDLYDEQRYDDWFEDVWGEIREVEESGARLFLGPYFRDAFPNAITILPICGEQQWHMPDGPTCVPSKWHVSGGRVSEWCTFGGSLSVAIQMVNYHELFRNDFDVIYLLGCDLGSDHFVDDYYDGCVVDTVPDNILDMDRIHAHSIARRCSRIPIYNATVGGNLEIYQRVDIMDLI